MILADDLRTAAAAGKIPDPSIGRRLADQIEERLVKGGDDSPITIDDPAEFIALKNLGDERDRGGGHDHVIALFRLARDWLGEET